VPNISIYNTKKFHSKLLAINKPINIDIPEKIVENSKRMDTFYHHLMSTLNGWLGEEYKIFSSVLTV